MINAAGGTGGRYRANLDCTLGGAGGGGSIRLVAPTLAGSGTLYTSNGGCVCWDYPCGENGKVRLEAFQHSEGYGIPAGSFTLGSPVKSFVPSAPPPSVAVTHVDGIKLDNPKGEFTPADVTINKSGSVDIKVVAHGVGLTTKDANGNDAPVKVRLHLFSLETTATSQVHDQIIDSTPLIGSVAESTATITVAEFPAGFTRGYVRVKW
jgi:hypothetical protein